jgi:hypothetical protein
MVQRHILRYANDSFNDSFYVSSTQNRGSRVKVHNDARGEACAFKHRPVHGPACVSQNLSERAHLRRRCRRAVKEYGGVIVLLLHKGSIFITVIWRWQRVSRHDILIKPTWS